MVEDPGLRDRGPDQNPTEIDAAVELIKRIRDRGVTLIVIEHVMKAIRNLSDRILVLFHGEKLTEGAPTVVLNDPQVVVAYLGRRYAEMTGGERAPALQGSHA